MITVKEAKTKKEWLQHSILGLIEEFEQDTDLTVTNIDLDRIDRSSMREPGTSILNRVTIEIRL